MRLKKIETKDKILTMNCPTYPKSGTNRGDSTFVKYQTKNVEYFWEYQEVMVTAIHVGSFPQYWTNKPHYTITMLI